MKNDPDKNTPAKTSACCHNSDAPSTGKDESEVKSKAPSDARVTLTIGGMTCGSCASKVRTALEAIDGVHGAQVNLATSVAQVRYDTRQADTDAMAAALAAAGYTGAPGGADPSTPSDPQAVGWLKASVVWGAAAAVVVVAFYLGLITLTSDWSNALYQFSEYGGWVIALAAGLSLQVGLFVRMRRIMAGGQAKGAGKGLAASGSMSGVAMALCCSHYLAAILPAVGLPFLSGAVAGLAEYQTAFFVIGVVSNLLGLAYMLRMMSKNGMIGSGTAYR